MSVKTMLLVVSVANIPPFLMAAHKGDHLIVAIALFLGMAALALSFATKTVE